MDLSKQLNPAQLEAVMTTEGPIAVFACAGSGKTRVITYRIAHLIADCNVHPSEIVACTFTNKAAGEMKERVAKLIGSEVKGLWIGTFHSLCLRILRADGKYIGFDSRFSIFDDEDSTDLVKRCMIDLHIDPKVVNYRNVSQAISKAKYNLLTPELYSGKAINPTQKQISAVYNLYQQTLEQMNAMDFDDLINNTIKLLSIESVGDKYAKKFRYVLVDEHQDINPAQDVLIKLFAKSGNIMIVGDDDQSIYRFRGATPSIMLDFRNQYPDAKIIKLETNYRSTKDIIDTAHQLVKNNKYREPKELVASLPGKEPVKLYTGLEPSDEASFVAQRIRTMVKDGRKYNDICILYRTNAQSRPFEDAFIAAGIPYRIVGGLRFYERKEIKDLLAYLKCALNPKDSNAFKRALGVPKRGFGPAFLVSLELAAKSGKCTLEEAMTNLLNSKQLKGTSANHAEDFLVVLDGIRDKANNVPASQVVAHIINEIGMIAYLKDGSEEGQSRAENVEEFLNLATEFEKVSDDQSVDAFLSTVQLLTDMDSVDQGTDRVICTTVHQAKGLEFPVVFLTGLEEGTFPHMRSMEAAEDIEEERRLAYVAITRAKEILMLTNVVNRQLWGSTRKCEPSRFLKEMNQAKIEKDIASKVTMKVSSAPPKILPKREPIVVVIGQTVDHSAWGEGKVVSVSGDNAEIEFLSVGKKLLNMKYAPVRIKSNPPNA
jgi:DNA helicase-2/ATP-dependent DNA helicase PcrA